MFNAERGGLYELSYPELNDMMEAKRFAENPEIRIAKVGTSLDWETEIRRAAAYKAETEKPFAMKEDSALKEEWYSMSRKEKEEFRKWMEWNRMSDEEREKFQEWINKGKE